MTDSEMTRFLLSGAAVVLTLAGLGVLAAWLKRKDD